MGAPLEIFRTISLVTYISIGVTLIAIGLFPTGERDPSEPRHLGTLSWILLGALWPLMALLLLCQPLLDRRRERRERWDREAALAALDPDQRTIAELSLELRGSRVERLYTAWALRGAAELSESLEEELVEETELMESFEALGEFLVLFSDELPEALVEGLQESLSALPQLSPGSGELIELQGELQDVLDYWDRDLEWSGDWVTERVDELLEGVQDYIVPLDSYED